MNMNKKWGIFIMMIIIVALSACSQGNQEVQTDDEIELTAWAWNTNVAALNSAIQLYQEEHPNVRLKVEDIGRLDVYDKLSTGLASGGVGLPDIVLVEDDRIHGYLEAFPNGFLNLADFGFDKKMELFPSFKQALTSKDGVPYAFPYDAGPTGVFYRTDIFEQAGVDAASIQTWEDYINAGIKIKETTDTLMVPVDKFNDDALFRMMMNQSGVYYFDQEGNIDFNHPDVIRAMETLSEMDQAGIIKNVIGWDGTVSATVDGSVATIPFGAWYYGTIIDQAKDTDGKWGVFLLPAFEAGGNRAANLGGSSWMIPAESEHKESVYDFMEFFATSDEVQQISMEKHGLFPSLNTVYESDLFQQEVSFFNGQKIWELFSEEMSSIPTPYYTEDYAIALDEATKAQADTFNGKKPAEALAEAAERLADRTGRSIN